MGAIDRLGMVSYLISMRTARDFWESSERSRLNMAGVVCETEVRLAQDRREQRGAEAGGGGSWVLRMPPPL